MRKQARPPGPILVPAEANNSARAPNFRGLAVNSHAGVRSSPVGAAEMNAGARHIRAADVRPGLNGQSNLGAAAESSAVDGDPCPRLAGSVRWHPLPAQADQPRLAKKDGRPLNPAPGGGLNPMSAGFAWEQPAVPNGRPEAEAASARRRCPESNVDRNRGSVGARRAKLKAEYDSREPGYICARPENGVAPMSDQPMWTDVTGGGEAAEAAPLHRVARVERSDYSDPGTATDKPGAGVGAEGGE
jgi:hypothetical protein